MKRMSLLAQVVKGKTFNVNGVDIEFRSLELDEETGRLLEASGDSKLSKKETMDMQKELVKRMLKDAIPDATEEEIQKCMRINPLMRLTEIFYDVNGMLDEKNVSSAQKMKDFIEKQKENRLKNAIKQKQDARKPKG